MPYDILVKEKHSNVWKRRGIFAPTKQSAKGQGEFQKEIGMITRYKVIPTKEQKVSVIDLKCKKHNVNLEYHTTVDALDGNVYEIYRCPYGDTRKEVLIATTEED